MSRRWQWWVLRTFIGVAGGLDRIGTATPGKQEGCFFVIPEIHETAVPVSGRGPFGGRGSGSVDWSAPSGPSATAENSGAVFEKRFPAGEFFAMFSFLMPGGFSWRPFWGWPCSTALMAVNRSRQTGMSRVRTSLSVVEGFSLQTVQEPPRIKRPGKNDRQSGCSYTGLSLASHFSLPRGFCGDSCMDRWAVLTRKCRISRSRIRPRSGKSSHPSDSHFFVTRIVLSTVVKDSLARKERVISRTTGEDLSGAERIFFR